MPERKRMREEGALRRSWREERRPTGREEGAGVFERELPEGADWEGVG
jgi:hypothetical protein